MSEHPVILIGVCMFLLGWIGGGEWVAVREMMRMTVWRKVEKAESCFDWKRGMWRPRDLE